MNNESEDTIIAGIIFVALLIGVVFGTLLYQVYERGIRIKQPPVEPVEMPIYDEVVEVV
jgi:L-cystine uptake protein TcyP (sodium:dicarboxylate symporter family)